MIDKDYYTVGALIERLQKMPSDTRYVGTVYTKFNLEPTFDIKPEDEENLLDTFTEYTRAFDGIWECWADAKYDTLGKFMCTNCDEYSYEVVDPDGLGDAYCPKCLSEGA